MTAELKSSQYPKEDTHLVPKILHVILCRLLKCLLSWQANSIVNNCYIVKCISAFQKHLNWAFLSNVSGVISV